MLYKRIGFRHRYTQSLTFLIGAEIDSFHPVCLSAQCIEFYIDFRIEIVVLHHRQILVIEGVVAVVLLLLVVHDTVNIVVVLVIECGLGFGRGVRMVNTGRLVPPEYAVEGQVDTVIVRIPLVSLEVEDSRESHGFVIHEMAVDGFDFRFPCGTDDAGKSLTRIRILDELFTLLVEGYRVVTTLRLVVIEQAVRYTADGIGSNTSTGRPRDELLVQCGHRSLRVVLRKMRGMDMQIAIGVDCTAVTRHIVLELAVAYYQQDIMGRRVGYVRYGIFRIIEVLRPVAIYEYTSATEIGLQVIRVAFVVCDVNMVGITALDGHAVENDGACTFRLLAFVFEVRNILATYGVRERVCRSVVSSIFDRQRS